MKVSSRGYGDAVRGLSHGKGAKVSLGRGSPTKREGSDGDLTLRNTNQGVILYAKYGGRWYSMHTQQGLVPGMIMMWSGQKHTIPFGWALCDGNTGTPDLRAKFIIGAGTGGVNIFDSGVPSYSTTIFGPSDDSYGTDSITYGQGDTVEVTAETASGTSDPHTLLASQIPEHTHDYEKSNNHGDVDHDSLGSGYTVADDQDTTTPTSVNAGGGGSHTHGLPSGIGVTGDTVKATAGLPLVDFYSLAFIMYVGSAADPGTEGYNQGGGEGGDSLGREGP
jgi:hypothetical protein